MRLLKPSKWVKCGRDKRPSSFMLFWKVFLKSLIKSDNWRDHTLAKGAGTRWQSCVSVKRSLRSGAYGPNGIPSISPEGKAPGEDGYINYLYMKFQRAYPAPPTALRLLKRKHGALKPRLTIMAIAQQEEYFSNLTVLKGR